MKKEIIVVCVLLLVFAGALVNNHFLGRLTGDVAALVEESLAHAENGDWDKADEKAQAAVERWTGSAGYTHLVLRHAEIEEATDALYNFLGQVLERQAGAARGAARGAAARLNSISMIEKVRLGSIF